MEIRASNINGMAGLIILVMSIFYVPYAESNNFHTIKLIDKPLILSPIPAQQAQANASFIFNLEPFVNSLKPEVNYQITFVWSMAQGASNGMPFQLSEPPSGFIQTNDGENTCSKPFKLKYNQSCTIRFYVDKNNYVYSGRTKDKNGNWTIGKSEGPVVRFGDFGAKVTYEQNFDSVLQYLARPTQFLVTPTAQDGLQYDSSLLSIVGQPTRSGNYHFTIIATNDKVTTEPKTLDITVTPNPHDTPVFKHNYSLASAMPEHPYRLNLMDLIESTPEFAVTNQVSFKIVLDKSHPSWLSLDQEKSTVLQGQPPTSDVGQIKEVTLIATSNTGGDSQPQTIQIPVAFDPEKKPVIEKGIKLPGEAGASINQDLRKNIADPTADGSLQLILDKIEPSAPWLSIEPSNRTQLMGIVPQTDVGQLYHLTLHANTAIGGNSDSVTIPLQIAIDQNQTPRFYLDNPQLPMAYAGQPYFYDFTHSNDITPEYPNIPYTVELAKEYSNPEWLRIENNKLIADEVPLNLKKEQLLFITIRNIPGGRSEVFSVSLFIVG